MVIPLARVLCCGLLSALCLAGCSANSSNPAEGMSVMVNFDDMHRCSRISPEITIYNAPRGTAYYEIRLTQVSTGIYLGGGTVSYSGLNSDGVDVIPMGVLRSYRGPCPSQGESASERRFTYSVAATDRAGNRLAVSNYTLFLEE